MPLKLAVQLNNGCAIDFADEKRINDNKINFKNLVEVFILLGIRFIKLKGKKESLNMLFGKTYLMLLESPKVIITFGLFEIIEK